MRSTDFHVGQHVTISVNGVTRMHGVIVEEDLGDLWAVACGERGEFVAAPGPDWFDLQPAEPDYSI